MNTKRKEMWDLEGTFVEHMRSIAERKESLFSYFHFKSKCWRAIQDHIWNADDCVLIDREKYPVVTHRGSGAAISFREAGVYAKNYDDPQNPKEADAYWLKFEVEYWDEEYDREISKTYTIDVPYALETNFSQDRFENWVEQKAEGKHRERNKKGLAELERLIDAFPDEAVEIVERLFKKTTVVERLPKKSVKKAKKKK